MTAPTRRSVRATYERIADHFAETRHHAWPEVEAFLDGREGRVGLDVGCGNGRHTALLADRVERALGVDASRHLLDAARGAGPAEFLQGDAAHLPLRGGTVDIAVYVATLHHLPTETSRRASLDELARVLAPGGVALVSAWSTAHDRFDADESFDTTIDWTLPDGEVVPRYYHIYSPAAFRAALDASALTTESARVSSGNCYAVVRRGNDREGGD